MGAWVVGHNAAGFLPTTEPDEFETWQEAAEHVKDLMIEYAEGTDAAEFDRLAIDRGYTSYEEVPEDEYPSMEATVGAILKDDGPRETEKAWSAWAQDNDYRLIEFWLMWSDDAEAPMYV